jgi:hypothetical protein
VSLLVLLVALYLKLQDEPLLVLDELHRWLLLLLQQKMALLLVLLLLAAIGCY